MPKPAPLLLRKSTLLILPSVIGGPLSVEAMRLFNGLLQYGQSLDLAPGTPPQLYVSPMTGLATLAGVEDGDAAPALKELVSSLVELRSNGGEIRTNLLTQGEMKTSPQGAVISWVFSTLVLEELQPNRYAELSMGDMAALETPLSLGLFEFLCIYQRSPVRMSCANTWAWWMEKFGQPAHGSREQAWGAFKADQLDGAIEEVNRCTSLQIELVEVEDRIFFSFKKS